jgi:ubiquitin C-terminal hydrolase
VENIIDQLYAGELVDYLRCIDVDYHSERVDKFLDFALAIVPFGSDTALHSLAECIETYLRPEILDGDNKYLVESVGRKVDAIKGLKVRCRAPLPCPTRAPECAPRCALLTPIYTPTLLLPCRSSAGCR